MARAHRIRYPPRPSIPLVTISPPRGNRFPHLGLALALLLIGLATLIPDASKPKPDLAVTCMLCGDLGGPDLILNVVLFVPFGLALSALGVRPFQAFGWALALSLAIEAVQIVLPGRSTTLRDALCNAGGAWLGAELARRLPDWLAPSRASLARVGAAALAAIATIALSGWLLGFAPSAPPYYGHWAPRQEHLAWWSGEITRAALDGIALPNWRVPDADPLRRAIADGFELEVAGRHGAPTSFLGGMVTLSDGRMREVLLAGPDGSDLVVHVRRRAADLRLAAPEFRFPGALRAAAAGTPLDIRIRASPTGACALVDEIEHCTARPATGTAWTLLLSDAAVAGTARILLNAITLGALALPLGLLLRTVPVRWAGGAIALLVIGVAAAARGSGVALPATTEWFGLVAGLVAGHLVDRLVTKARTRESPGLIA